MKALNKNVLFKHKLLCSLVILTMHSAYAGTVRDDIDYQQFRDFAENKGEFTTGETKIQIKDKDGNVVDTLFTDGISMPDWSAVNTGNSFGNGSGGNKGIATLIDPQYIVSVSHNGGYQDVQFGSNDNQNPDNEKFNYKLVERNNYEKTDEFGDYHQPRLHKLVTETAPIPVVERLTNFSETPNAEKDNFRERFPVLARMGSGVQVALNEEQAKNHRDVNIGYAIDDNGKKYSKEEILANNWGELVTNGYHFLTGGILLPVHEYNESQKGTLKFGSGYNLKGLNNNHNPSDKIDNISALSIGIMSGDSGSPIFAYDKNDKQWKLIALAQGNLPAYWVSSETREEFFNFFNNVGVGSLNKDEFNQEKRNQDIAGTINNLTANQIYDWNNSNDGNSTLGNLSVSLENNGNLHNGKTVYFTGEKGTLNLKNNINQGAGALYFDTDFTVKGENDNTTWLGAGVSVAKDKTVEWQIKNPENDRLSKIGEGTLLVNGTGENKGDISVGDGLVVLNQQGGKAFNKVGIVSGRPTVKLENSNQVNPDNIHFGYRGGRLDVNGNDLTFNYIKNVDEGAKIVNHLANKTANIEIGRKNPTKDDIIVTRDINQVQADIYHYDENGLVNFMMLDENGVWQWAGWTLEEALPKAIEKRAKALEGKIDAYNGSFGETDSNKTNGKLNVTYKPEVSGTTYLISGGTNLNGNLTVEKGSLLLSGRPTPHAYDHINKIEPFKDNDWINRNFNATNIIANNDSVLTIGRNVQEVNANITANHTAKVQLGFVNGKTPVCVRSDYFGTTTCETNTYDDTVLKTIPTTQIKGDLILNDTAQVTLGNVHLTGKSTTNKDSNLTLTKDAKWTMTNDSTLGNLVMENGSEITLNKNYENNNNNQFNTLTIQGNLSGQGKFNYLTNLTENKSDKIVVNGTASGTYVLKVKDKGTEPKKDDLVLLTANNRNNLNVTLENANDNNKNFVDWGTWRYELVDKNNQFVLAGKNTSSNNTGGNTDTNNTGNNTDTNNTGNNTDTNNTGGNTDTNNTGGNTDTNNTGGNTDTNNTGGNTDTNNTGGNTDTNNTGGNTNTNNTGNNTDTNNTGGNTDTNNTGNNTDTNNTGNNTDTNNTGGNTDTNNTGGNTDTNNTGGNTDTNNTGNNTDTNNTGGNTDTNNTGGNTNTNNTGGNNTMLTTEISKYTNLAISAQSAQIQNMLHTVENLQHRLWNDTPKLEGIWFTHDYMRQKNNTNYHRPYKNTYNIFQIGIDKNIVRERGRFLLGGAISYTDSSQDFDEGTGNGDLTMASIYGQYLSNKKYMMNFDVGYGVAKNKLKLDQKVSNYEQSVAHLGLGVGKTWQWDNTAIQPHLATHYHRFSGENYQLNGANVEQKATNLFSHQAGLKVAQTFNRPSGMNVMPYFSTTYTNVSGNAKIDFNNNRFVLPIEDYWQHKIGVDVQKGAWQGGANVGFIKDKNQTKDFSTGLNLSYRW